VNSRWDTCCHSPGTMSLLDRRFIHYGMQDNLFAT
jgi:hypothetical protein